MRTVQGHLEEVAVRVCNQPVRIHGSGRTDAGVHAIGQVADIETDSRIPPDRIGHAIHSRVDEDVAVLCSTKVRDDFDASRSAVSKLYRYRIRPGDQRHVLDRRVVLQYRHPLDLDPMKEAASRFEGRHDFTSLAASGDQRVDRTRTIMRCQVGSAEGEIFVDVEADGFLYKMVRNIVGILLEVGRGRYPPEIVDEIIAARDNQRSGPTAPPHGLCLQWVRYPTEACE
jgi:tRNA pseudouridine38-40 synthase